MSILAYTLPVNQAALGKQDLLRRRPVVNEVSRWVARANIGLPNLDSTSTQLVSRVMRQAWKVLDTLRELDTAQPVAQQILLGQVTSMSRAMAIVWCVAAPHCRGSVTLQVTDSGNKALQSLEAYDPALQAASFDLVAALQTVLRSTRFI